MKKQDAQESRRTFIKTVAYVAPAVVTLKAAPAFARTGSGPGSGSGGGSRRRPRPRR